MKIDKNTVATLSYTLTDNDTEAVLQLINEEKPEEFMFGQGLMIDFFEDSLIGLQENDSFDFVINCDQAYGPVDPGAIFDLPNSSFANEDGTFEEGVLQIGNVFPMQDNEGYRHYGKMIKLMEESVTMDFNHPLAGKDLRFRGKIAGVRKSETHDHAHHSHE
ncbi:MAG: peptidylprolyl isomerase [Bacteroidales bacterium]|nr:peptidylprolyl isomerase [Bacteroidales bacterium]